MTPKQNKMTWLDWVQNILIISAVVIFTLNYTIVGVVKGGWFSLLKNLVMIGIFMLFVYRFFTVSKAERKQWFTQKFLRVPSFVWLLAYFIVRCICFAVNGFQYGIAREIFFEFVFLVAICPWTVGPRVRFDIIAWIFCGINLVMNLANTYCCHVLKVFYEETGGSPVDGGLLGFLTHLKTYSLYGPEVNVAPMYSNPNSAGIMTGIAILMSFCLIRSKKYLHFFFIYWIYSSYALYMTGSRGAMLGVLAAIVSFVVLRLFRNVSPKIVVCVCLIGCTIIAAGLYGEIGYQISKENRNLSPVEQQINSISTGRYTIWKVCYVAHQDKWLLGEGNETLEKRARNDQLKADYIINHGTEDGFLPTTFSVHNGYLATIFITGWIGFVLFNIILIDKIKKSTGLSKGKKYSYFLAMILIFSLTISNFEALLITSRYYTILIILLVLAWDYCGQEKKADEATRRLEK